MIKYDKYLNWVMYIITSPKEYMDFDCHNDENNFEYRKNSLRKSEPNRSDFRPFWEERMQKGWKLRFWQMMMKRKVRCFY